MRPILKQMMLVLAVLLPAATSGSAQVLSPVYSFTTNDAISRTEGLLLSSNTLYGTAVGGPLIGAGKGSSQFGAMFKLNTDGTGYTNLYFFSPIDPLHPPSTNTDGANPAAQMALSGNRLYGTAERGGFYGNGIVFAINTDGTGFTNLHNFTPTVQDSGGFLTNGDGTGPFAGLVLSGNTLYGATDGGGSFAAGTVFAIDTDGTGFTNLFNFPTNTYGGKKTMILSSNTLYGTDIAGGASGNGMVFALNTDGTGFTNLHSFSSLVRDATIPPHHYTNSDGALPQGGLVLSVSKLYGTTLAGGTGSGGYPDAGGTVFALNTDGTGFTNLHSFDYNAGASPAAGLVLSGNTLYGTAQSGGGLSQQQDGAVFAINTDGTGFATLHTFTPTQPNYDSSGDYTNADGATPVGNLILSGSTLYGATQIGGTNGRGTIFALDLTVAAPTIQFTANPSNGITRLTVQFNSAAVDAGDNAILAWNWNFGDGSNSVSTVQNPTHTYTKAATFLPTLTCLNNYGNTVIGSGPAVITHPPPPIQFTANPTNGSPSPMAVQFNSPAVDAGSNTIISWNWNFGDGSNSAAQNPSHTYTNSGTYFPSLTCSNNNGDRIAGFGPVIVVPSSILLNGGFETGTFTNWTLRGIGFVTGSYAHSGKRGAGLEASGTMGFLSQTLATTPGGVYLISFWLDSPSGTTATDFQVSWNGNLLLDRTNLATIGWTNIQLTVTAMATNSTLQFGYLTGGSFFGLDDIIVTIATPMTQPDIANISLSGANLVLNGTGGLSNRVYRVLMGTNLIEPFNQWSPVATIVPAADGNFSTTATNAVSPNTPQRFYILQLQ